MDDLLFLLGNDAHRRVFERHNDLVINTSRKEAGYPGCFAIQHNHIEFRLPGKINDFTGDIPLARLENCVNPGCGETILTKPRNDRLEFIFALQNLLGQIAQAAFQFPGYQAVFRFNFGYGCIGMKNGDLDPIEVATLRLRVKASTAPPLIRTFSAYAAGG